MIKVIFFDLDDTLFDQTYGSREALSNLRSLFKHLQKISLDDLCELHNKLLNQVHKEFVLTGKMSIEKARTVRFRQLFENIAEIENETDHVKAADIYRQVYLENRILIDGSKDLLENLHRKYKLGIISNNQHQEQMGKLEHLGILHYFDKVITSEMAGFKKPDKWIFEKALNEFKVKPDEAVLIGDDWETDITGALNSGIKAIWFNRYEIKMPTDSQIKEINSLILAEDIIRLL